MRFAGLILAASLLGVPSAAQESTANSGANQRLTAQEVVERIKAHVGIPWMTETVDTFKAGDPQTPVTGIAVTMMATLDVLQRAAANKQNLIITHEPTFHDHQHRMKVDQVELGNVHKLGWEKYQDPANQYLFTIPATTVAKLSAELKTKMGASAIRVVGERSMKVTRVALSPGFAGSKREIGALEMQDVQVLIAGETREWETVEYVADAATEGRQKALIVVSHVPS